MRNNEGVFQLPQGCFFFFSFKNIIKVKTFELIFITGIFKNKVMEGQRLNSKYDHINEKKLSMQGLINYCKYQSVLMT